MSHTITQVLAEAYAQRVLHRAPQFNIEVAFAAGLADETFASAAKAELARLRAFGMSPDDLDKRCSVSAHTLRFLQSMKYEG